MCRCGPGDRIQIVRPGGACCSLLCRLPAQCFFSLLLVFIPAHIITSSFVQLVNILFLFLSVAILKYNFYNSYRGAVSSVINELGMKQVIKVDFGDVHT